jgi:phospholipid/cholesterol/gamma-HCH transport system substrate-binding protein
MVTKAQKVRLGVFLIIGSILILIFLGVVVGNQLFQKKDIYYVQYEDVSVAGLQVGGNVQYHGIKIGRVEAIKIYPRDVSKVILSVSVERGTPIKEDVIATLLYVGVTGLKTVELTGGTNKAKLLKPGSYIKSGSSVIDTITGKAESIATKIDLIASNLAGMTNQENQKNLAEILRQTSKLLGEVGSNLTQTLTSLNTIAANAAEVASSASTNLNKISNHTSAQIDSIGGNLNRSITELNLNTNLLIADTRSQVNRIGDHSDQLITKTSNEIENMTVSINSTLSRINQIVSTPQFDSLIVNVNTISGKLASADLKQLVTDLNATVVQTNNLVGNLDRTVSRGRSDLLDTLESLRQAAENLNDFSKQISDNPSSLIIGK